MRNKIKKMAYKERDRQDIMLSTMDRNGAKISTRRCFKRSRNGVENEYRSQKGGRKAL